MSVMKNSLIYFLFIFSAFCLGKIIKLSATFHVTIFIYFKKLQLFFPSFFLFYFFCLLKYE